MKKRIFSALLLIINSMAFAQPLSWYDFDNGNSVDLYHRNDLTKSGASSAAITDWENIPNAATVLNQDVFSSTSFPTARNSNERAITVSLWFYVDASFSGTKTLVNSGITQDISDFNSPINALGRGYAIYLVKSGSSSFTVRTAFADKPTASTANRYAKVTSLSYGAPTVGEWFQVVVRLRTRNTSLGFIMEVDQYVYEKRSANPGNGGFDVTGATSVSTNAVYGPLTNTTFSIGDGGSAVGIAVDDLVIYDSWLPSIEVVALNEGKKILTLSQNASFINTLPNPASNRYLNDVEVVLTANTLNNTNRTFLNWLENGATVNGSNPLSINMTANRNFGAKYTSGTIFVDKDATGASNGASWSDAFTDLESAIASFTPGDEIWVADGVYKPSSNTGFIINVADMKIYGGFNGTETSLNQRDVIANETILSGDLGIVDVPQGNYTSYLTTNTRIDNAKQIIITSSLGENLLLDGLTISDAQKTDINTNLVGGAIVKSTNLSKLTIKNCTIKNNVSAGGGAGLTAEFTNTTTTTKKTGEIIIENCRFTNNWGAWGTGVYIANFSNFDVNANVSNTLFDNNYTSDGSSISSGGISSPAMWLRNLDANTILQNATTLTANVVNCTFANNQDLGTSRGSSLSNKSVLSISRRNTTNTAQLNLRNSIFYGNYENNNNTVTPVSSSIDTAALVPSQKIDLDNNLAEQSWGVLPLSSTNNTHGNPMFADATNGDFTLQTGSSAIDSGDNTYVIGAADLANKQRIFNTTVDRGAYEFGAISLSIKSFDSNETLLSLYPNPVQNKLDIEVGGKLKLVEVYNILGKKVLSSNQLTVNVSALNSGVYFLKVQIQNGAIATKKFIKK